MSLDYLIAHPGIKASATPTVSYPTEQHKLIIKHCLSDYLETSTKSAIPLPGTVIQLINLPSFIKHNAH